MGRAKSEFTLRWRGEARGWYVRAQKDGAKLDRATGVKSERAESKAQRAGREIYKQWLTEEKQPRTTRPASATPVEDATGDWLASLALRAATKELYGKFADYWLAHWRTAEQMDESSVALYFRRRMREAMGVSVATEVSAMRGFFRWCVLTGLLPSSPEIQSVSKRGGTPSGRRTRIAAPEYTPEEMAALIRALPEFSGRDGWPVKARAIVAYTTTLRPWTLERLSAPEHYAIGATHLRITPDIDKEGFGRQIKLAQVARDALDSITPSLKQGESAMIFGAHRLGPYLEAAARLALPEEKRAGFCAQHFRSAGLTRALDLGASLTGVAHNAGHTRVSTTARYARPSLRESAKIAEAWDEDEFGN